MNFINVNGTKLHYRFDGAADLPVLVLSHSLGTDLSMWDLQIPEFTQHFRVLRYDMRGHGASEATPGPYTIEQLAMDVVGLLDGLEIERANFCGISIGGMIGIWLAGHVPERLTKLALCNTVAYKGAPETFDSRIASVLMGGMDAVVNGSLKTCFSASFHDTAPSEVDKLRRMVLATSPEGYAACCAAIRDMDQRDTIGRITVPSLVIGGSEDLSMPSSVVQLLAEQIPGAEYLELAAAHLSNIEAAELFTAEIVKFMR
ncbi:3-oxoadipate enol-lactonase [Bacillus sp. FJAT-49705]|uniref:3-oxoadipate enol-lactonase n=1 Tax=Cytobacillus citreus TaxID=2833586 RepID=A0ABS5NX32_9BACI|nr:3-oxoadipate enol-lactonase [Cytobacillus citreus]MBS4192385.1 3-oxoadipate enol-lactonase [Cytobacillus citreus]